MGTTGTIQQEMTRILVKMRCQGVKYAWLSEENLKAMQPLAGQFLNTVNKPAPQFQPQPSPAPQFQPPPSPAPQFKPQPSPAPQFQPPPSPAPQFRPQSPAPQFQPPPSPPPQFQPQRQSPPLQPPQPQPYMQQVAPAPPPRPVQRQPIMQESAKVAEHAEACKGADWNRLAELAKACSLCGLADLCKHKLYYIGATKVRVLFVGDFPTSEEDESGTPFSGQAGQMLFNMGKAMGLNWSENALPQTAAGYANVLKCRPTTVPSESQLTACLPMLQRQIELLSPDALVLLGAIPTKLLTGKSGFTKLKGTWDTYLGLPAAIIQSPSIIVRFAKQQQVFLQERKQAWATLQEVMKSLQLVKM